MSILFNVAGEAIKRTTGLPSPASDYTATFWVRLNAVGVGLYRTYYLFVNDAAGTYDPYVWIGNGGNTIPFMEVFNGSLQGQVFGASAMSYGVWYPFAYVREGTANRFYFNGALAGSITEDLSALTFDELWTGDDSFSGQTNFNVAQFREWESALTLPELQAEWTTQVAVIAEFTDTPLLNDLLDDSGNGHTWSAIGSTSFSVDTPPIVTQQAPGWFSRATTDTVTTSTTGTLVLPLPDRTEDGDILIMSLAHKGGGFATLPGGWTLVEQDSSDTVFGEMHWKRANGEASSFSVTGTGAVGRGVIRAYGGGLASGDVLHASVIRANAGSTPSGGGAIELAWPTLPVTDDRVLLVGMGAIRDTTTVFTDAGMGCLQNATPFLNQSSQPNDADIQTMARRASATGASGAALGVFDAIKIVAGDTGEGTLGLALGSFPPNVCILAAFLPQEDVEAYRTRLYLTSRNLGVPRYGEIDGDWRSTINNATALTSFERPTTILSTRKCDSGPRNFASGTSGTTNLSQGHANEKEVGVLFNRGRFGPLAAQTLGGTFDILTAVRAAWIEGNTPGTCEVVYQVHAFITDGDSMDVREVIIDNYRDTSGTIWLTTAAGDYTALDAPIAVTGTIEEGDYIVVELGAYIVDSPNPVLVEQYPAEDYVRMNILVGATNGGGSGVPLFDVADVPPPVTGTVGYLEFSQPLELIDPGISAPTNISCATATEILTLPYNPDVIDTTTAPSSNRKLWWTWEADEDCRIFVRAWGSTYAVTIQSFVVAACGSMTGVNSQIESSHFSADGFGGGWSQASRAYDLEEGDVIFFSVRTTNVVADNNISAPSTGGSLAFTVAKYSAPQDNDVFVTAGAGNVMCYREGQLVNMSAWTGFGGSIVWIGLGIDTTHRPLDTYAGGDPNTTDRLLVSDFFGDYIAIFDIPYLGLGPVGAADPEELANIFPASLDGPLGDDQVNIGSLSVNGYGELAVGYFGKGFQYIAAGAGGSILSAFLDRAADTAPSTANSAYINLTDAIYAEPMPETWPPALEAEAAFESGGITYLEYSLDGTKIYYTSGAWYLPSNPGYDIKCIDAATGAQLADFATVPAGTGPRPSARGIFPLLDGGMLVCNGSIVQRLDSAGAVTQTYTPTPAYLATILSDVELTSDGDAFWVLDLTSTTLFKFNLTTGEQLNTTWIQIGHSTSYSLQVYRSEPFPTPPIPPPERPTTATYLIRRLRRSVHLSSENFNQFFSRLEIEFQPGVGTATGQGQNPKAMLRWSKDGGFTWSSEIWVEVGRQGEYDRRAIWNRIGSGRDVIFEVSMSDPVFWAIARANIFIERGTS